MVATTEQSDEISRLFGQQSEGLDLTAPTPELPRAEPEQFPEDATFLGLSANKPAERAQIKLNREKQNLSKLESMFGIHDKVIKTAQTLDDERRIKYLDKILPSVERVFPGSSQTIRDFADDREGYKNLLKQFSDPKQKAILDTLGKSGDFAGVLKSAEGFLTKKATGSSEFERLRNQAEASELITEKEATRLTKKRVGVLAGTDVREGQKQSLQERRFSRKQKFTKSLRDEANEGIEHFAAMDTNISDALAQISSGNHGLSDTFLAQVLSQVKNTDIKALAMFQQFDKSYGNVAERTINSVGRFITGSRSEGEKATIQEVLENFRDAHVRPGVNKMKTQYRNLATEEGVDPFKVVPPKPGCQYAKEIRDYPGIDRDEKARLLKVYYSKCFPGSGK